MQKIVVEWDRDGGYECGSYPTVACLEYESTEAFYIHLEEKLRQYLDASNQYQANLKEWQVKNNKAIFTLHQAQRKSKKRPEVVKEAQEAFDKVIQEMPEQLESRFEFAGKKFYAEDFIVRGTYSKTIPYVAMPTIKTLEEWFHYKETEFEP